MYLYTYLYTYRYMQLYMRISGGPIGPAWKTTWVQALSGAAGRVPGGYIYCTTLVI